MIGEAILSLSKLDDRESISDQWNSLATIVYNAGRSARKAESTLAASKIEILSLYKGLLMNLNDVWKGASSLNNILLFRISMCHSVKRELTICLEKVREAKYFTKKALELLHGLTSHYSQLQFSSQSRYHRWIGLAFAYMGIKGRSQDSDIWWKLYIPNPLPQKRIELGEMTKLMQVAWSKLMVLENVLAELDRVIMEFHQKMAPIRQRDSHGDVDEMLDRLTVNLNSIRELR